MNANAIPEPETDPLALERVKAVAAAQYPGADIAVFGWCGRPVVTITEGNLIRIIRRRACDGGGEDHLVRIIQ